MILFFLFYFFELPPSITGSSSCLISRIPQADAYEPIVVAPHYNMTVQVQPIYYDDFTQPSTFVGHFTTTPMKTEDLSTFLPAFDISFRPFSIFSLSPVVYKQVAPNRTVFRDFLLSYWLYNIINDEIYKQVDKLLRSEMCYLRIQMFHRTRWEYLYLYGDPLNPAHAGATINRIVPAYRQYSPGYSSDNSGDGPHKSKSKINMFVG